MPPLVVAVRHERLGRWQISILEWPSQHTAPTLGSMPISSAARRKVSAAGRRNRQGGIGACGLGARHARLAGWPVQQTACLSSQYTAGRAVEVEYRCRRVSPGCGLPCVTSLQVTMASKKPAGAWQQGWMDQDAPRRGQACLATPAHWHALAIARPAMHPARCTDCSSNGEPTAPAMNSARPFIQQ